MNEDSGVNREQKPVTGNQDSVATNDHQQTLHFAHHHAFVIGINAYEKVSPLATAVNDARKIAQVLGEKHQFKVYPPVLDPTLSTLHTLLHETMPGLVGSDDRVVFYFAGHGIASDGDDGPAGYLAPADADPAELKTFIAMTELREALNSLPCRHLLIILDCCFSGAFKWTSGTRSIGSLIPKQIYKERFDRFIHDPAWQVITSAAYDQKALDIVQDRPTGDRGLVASESGEAHSPFALALFEALAGDADARTGRESDGLITATELYSYVRDQVEPATIDLGQQKRQTPGFFPLSKHDKGEFIFLHPRHRLNLPSRPSHSPYKGLLPFEESDAALFYGRDQVIAELKSRLASTRLLVVSGASGTGKSSVVKAGLLPWLREAGHLILPVIRPGDHPLATIEQALTGLAESNPQGAVLVVDQLEEVMTDCTDQAEREAFLARLRQVVDDSGHIHCVIITVRADFESRFSSGSLKGLWQDGLYMIPPLNLEELMAAAVMPTIQEVMIFDPPEMVDNIIGDVVQTPGALPLLSCTLDELYQAYNASGRQDRAMNQSDYDKLGGVMGIMRRKADALYQSLDPDRQVMMRKIFLRMVTVEGDLVGKRAPIADLDYSPQENLVMAEVIDQLVEARLIVHDTNSIEPAHPALVRTWKTLLEWIQAVGRDTLLLGERLGQQADQYSKSGNVQLLWNKNPNLANAARLLQQPHHGFNAQEVSFVRKSIARNLRRKRIVWAITVATIVALSGLSVWALIERKTAQDEKDRAILSLFEGLNLTMANGNFGSLCANGICDGAPIGDGKAKWQSLGELPLNALTYHEEVKSWDFAAARQFGKGHVLAYAQDGLTRDRELTEESDNLLFVQNALAWLTPLNYNCSEGIQILVWEGSYAKIVQMEEVQNFADRRGWILKKTTPETLENDLKCGSVLWYLSDWDPPQDFTTKYVPLIVNFVQEGGGLLMGGLGWSYDQQYEGTDTTYSADDLGKPFGVSFTLDIFDFDKTEPIRLLPGH
ncbi:MAG: caspase family protein [Saprospiraceae bacterium]